MDKREEPINLKEDEAKEIFRAAYQHFRKKEYKKTLDILDPFLSRQWVDHSKINWLSLLWGVKGDAHNKLHELDMTLAAFHKSIELDAYSGCVVSYAYLVAKHHIVHEAINAEECLVRFKKHMKEGRRVWRAIAWFFTIFYMPGAWWDIHIVTPFVRKKLSRMTSNLKNQRF
jgi:tetratricopeptide (TPR) repeat protein